MSDRKSNQNICDFYKDKSKDALTSEYFKQWNKNKSSNAYLELYESFCKEMFSCENADNESLYRVIEAWEDIEKAEFPIEIIGIRKDKTLNGKNKKHIRTIQRPSEMPNLDFLKGVNINLLNPCQNQEKEANQKWHLFVGIFAYSVVCIDSFDWKAPFSERYSCLILRLWMIENAENQESALKEIKAAIYNGNSKRTNELINNAFKTLLEER